MRRTHHHSHLATRGRHLAKLPSYSRRSWLVPHQRTLGTRHHGWWSVRVLRAAGTGGDESPATDGTGPSIKARSSGSRRSYYRYYSRSRKYRYELDSTVVYTTGTVLVLLATIYRSATN